MSNEVIEYISPQKTINSGTTELETTTKSGVTCSWSAKLMSNYDHYHNDYVCTGLKFLWNFNWEELIIDGVDGLTGHIIVKPVPGSTNFNELKIDVDLTEDVKLVKKDIPHSNQLIPYCAFFEYYLIPHRIPIQDSYEEMFLPSDQNDSILVVEEKKLHVSKAFLSYHSDYFRALFSSNFKEGQMDEIPIGDISLEDFGLLASSFYPKAVFPTDRTVEKLLEMADRFMVSSVISIVEYHLIHNTKIGNEKLMWLADKYGMSQLLEKCVFQMNTIEKAKKLKESPEYKMLSNDAKASVLDKLMQLI